MDESSPSPNPSSSPTASSSPPAAGRTTRAPFEDAGNPALIFPKQADFKEAAALQHRSYRLRNDEDQRGLRQAVQRATHSPEQQDHVFAWIEQLRSEGKDVRQADIPALVEAIRRGHDPAEAWQQSSDRRAAKHRPPPRAVEEPDALIPMTGGPRQAGEFSNRRGSTQWTPVEPMAQRAERAMREAWPEGSVKAKELKAILADVERRGWGAKSEALVRDIVRMQRSPVMTKDKIVLEYKPSGREW